MLATTVASPRYSANTPIATSAIILLTFLKTAVLDTVTRQGGELWTSWKRGWRRSA
jgi:hypothetical protein